MTGSNSKFYLKYLGKLVDGYNNTYQDPVARKPIDEKIETYHKTSKFKVCDRVKIPKYKNIFSKICVKTWSREISVIDSVLKTNLWACKIENSNRETITESFYKNKSC